MSIEDNVDREPLIAAHLIIGGRPEPFLPALLISLEGMVDCLIVNENSGLDTSDNLLVLRASSFYKAGTMQLIRSNFTTFSAARNACLNEHLAMDHVAWVAFVDADEVHGAQGKTIAKRLSKVPAHINFVDGYTYHFFQSFDWYKSIERRMSFHRFSPKLRWIGDVHEHLVGLPETRLALPYLYSHYGHVLPVIRHVDKNHQYANLGDHNSPRYTDDFEKLSAETYFMAEWSNLLRFTETPPVAAASTIAQLKIDLAPQFSATENYARKYQKGLTGKLSRSLRRINYDIRWKSRLANPIAMKMLL